MAAWRGIDISGVTQRRRSVKKPRQPRCVISRGKSGQAYHGVASGGGGIDIVLSIRIVTCGNQRKRRNNFPIAAA